MSLELDQYTTNDRLYYRANELARPAFEIFPLKITRPTFGSLETVIYYHWLGKYTLSGEETKTYTYTNIQPVGEIIIERAIVRTEERIRRTGEYKYVLIRMNTNGDILSSRLADGDSELNTYPFIIPITDPNVPSSGIRVVRVIQSRQLAYPANQLIESYRSSVMFDIIARDTEPADETGDIDYEDLVYKARVESLIE